MTACLEIPVPSDEQASLGDGASGLQAAARDADGGLGAYRRVAGEALSGWVGPAAGVFTAVSDQRGRQAGRLTDVFTQTALRVDRYRTGVQECARMSRRCVVEVQDALDAYEAAASGTMAGAQERVRWLAGRAARDVDTAETALAAWDPARALSAGYDVLADAWRAASGALQDLVLTQARVGAWSLVRLQASTARHAIGAPVTYWVPDSVRAELEGLCGFLATTAMGGIATLTGAGDPELSHAARSLQVAEDELADRISAAQRAARRAFDDALTMAVQVTGMLEHIDWPGETPADAIDTLSAVSPSALGPLLHDDPALLRAWPTLRPRRSPRGGRAWLRQPAGGGHSTSPPSSATWMASTTTPATRRTASCSPATSPVRRRSSHGWRRNSRRCPRGRNISRAASCSGG